VQICVVRSVIEWGVGAYRVEKGSQQDDDVSVVIWPGEHAGSTAAD
jgi:hypothetical protein